MNRPAVRSCGIYCRRGPLAIIIEPTRELAQQTHEQLDLFKKHLTAPSLEILLLVGGMPVPPALNALKKGVDIITATPGKLMGNAPPPCMHACACAVVRVRVCAMSVSRHSMARDRSHQVGQGGPVGRAVLCAG